MSGVVPPAGLEGGIIGNYELGPLLGKGGMALVHRARHRKRGETVALKLIHSHLTEDTRLISGLKNEARIGRLLRHPNIVKVFDFGMAERRYFMAMEYVAGTTLDVVLSRCVHSGHLMSPGAYLDLMTQIAEGLHYAHSFVGPQGPLGLIHRDLKPANLLLSSRGVVKLMDFGIAKAAMNEGETTKTNVTKGTPRYMSPEQVRGEDLTQASDIFSLGSLLYELVTLKPLFAGSSLVATMHLVITQDLRPAFDELEAILPGLGIVFARATARDLSYRYPTVRQMADDLHQLTGSLTPEQFGETLPRLMAGLEKPELWGPAMFPPGNPPTRKPPPRPAAPARRPASAPAPQPAPAAPPPSPDSRQNFWIAVMLGTALVLFALSAAVIVVNRMRQSQATPTPAPSEQPSATPAPTAEATPEPTATPAATPEPTPEATAEPTTAPSAAPTPAASAPPSPAASAAPTPEPTATPVSTPPPAATPSVAAGAMGSLSLQTTFEDNPTWAQVLLNGQPLGETPMYAQPVPAGRISLELRCQGNAAHSQMLVLDVAPDAPVRQTVGLQSCPAE